VVISKAFAPDKATAHTDETAITETTRFTATEIMAIKAMLIRNSINIISNKVSSAVIRMDTIAVTSMAQTTTAHLVS
jgi:hypothetical protein